MREAAIETNMPARHPIRMVTSNAIDCPNTNSALAINGTYIKLSMTARSSDIRIKKDSRKNRFCCRALITLNHPQNLWESLASNISLQNIGLHISKNT